MQALAGLAIATLTVASIAVGVRLLALHRRSGQAPELLLGLMLLLSVGFGYSLMIVSTRFGPEIGNPLLGLGSFATALGFSCLIAFTGYVFRRGSRWARAVTAIGSALLLGTALWVAVDVITSSGSRSASEVTVASVLQGATVMAAYLWTSWESLRYRGMVKRRLQLGMGDPVVCNRLLLWGLMGLIVSAGIVLNLVAGLRGLSIVESPLVLLGSSMTGMSQTILLVLAFAPPRAYLAWVQRAAPAASAP